MATFRQCVADNRGKPLFEVKECSLPSRWNRQEADEMRSRTSAQVACAKFGEA